MPALPGIFLISKLFGPKCLQTQTFNMNHPIRTPADLGSVIRAVRKHAKVRQDDLAGVANVSRQFAIDAERGKPTMQFGKLLQLLSELGITLAVELPEDVEPALKKVQTKRQQQASEDAAGTEQA